MIATGGDGPTRTVSADSGLLEAAFARAQKDKKLTIGYFGGSITDGSGASDAAKTSWRALTTAYLREKLPGVQVAEVNAAIGGTGSDLGVFRIQNDLLRHKPGLVFVEFAVNDAGKNETRTLRAMEGIVRSIRRSDPGTGIVFVYTATKKMDEEAYAKGQSPASVAFHHRVATHYSIPEVNVGEILAADVRTKHGGDWKAMTRDDVHPNDAGYAVYAAEVRAFLERHIEARNTGETTSPGAPTLLVPAPLVKNPLEYGTMIDAWELPDTTGWAKEPEPLGRHVSHRLSASQPGTELRVPFTGDAIGLYWLIAPDSGDIEWRIDDGPWKRASSWDKYALSFTRANYTILSDTLSPGRHNLTVRVLPDKNPESTGTFVRIGALLVHESPPEPPRTSS
jgi:lysophospholipase L1-like esterase